MTEPITLDYAGVAASTSFSESYIRQAHRAGDLRGFYPAKNGKKSTKPVFFPDDVKAWIRGETPTT